MQVGGYKIVFQADPPDPARIPASDLLGVTVILLSCFYKDREFIRRLLLSGKAHSSIAQNNDLNCSFLVHL